MSKTTTTYGNIFAPEYAERWEIVPNSQLEGSRSVVRTRSLHSFQTLSTLLRHGLYPLERRTKKNFFLQGRSPDQGAIPQITLAIDPVTGDYTRITRFRAGTNTKTFGVKAHNYPEEIFVISGRMYDRAFKM